MVSKMAMDEIDSLAAEGIKLTPQEIIRLNAFGLKVEKGVDAAEQFALPRFATLGNLTLRQPTIGSEIWMQQASQMFETMASPDTFLALRIYSLSKKQDELVSPYDTNALVKEIEELKEKLKPLTYDQIDAALSFVVQGFNHFDCEMKSTRKREDKEDDGEGYYESDDEYSCVEVGLMKDGLMLNLGTISELKDMTTSSLLMLVDYKKQAEFGVSHMKANKNRRLVDYYCVLEDIKDAAKKRAEDEANKEEVNNGKDQD